MTISFEFSAWEDYIQIEKNDKRYFQKINTLIKHIKRNPTEGIGKPEPLKNDLSGYWSRQIDKKNRLIYSFSDKEILIISVKGHYKDK